MIPQCVAPLGIAVFAEHKARGLHPTLHADLKGRARITCGRNFHIDQAAKGTGDPGLDRAQRHRLADLRHAQPAVKVVQAVGMAADAQCIAATHAVGRQGHAKDFAGSGVETGAGPAGNGRVHAHPALDPRCSRRHLAGKHLVRRMRGRGLCGRPAQHTGLDAEAQSVGGLSGFAEGSLRGRHRRRGISEGFQNDLLKAPCPCGLGRQRQLQGGGGLARLRGRQRDLPLQGGHRRACMQECGKLATRLKDLNAIETALIGEGKAGAREGLIQSVISDQIAAAAGLGKGPAGHAGDQPAPRLDPAMDGSRLLGGSGALGVEDQNVNAGKLGVGQEPLEFVDPCRQGLVERLGIHPVQTDTRLILRGNPADSVGEQPGVIAARRPLKVGIVPEQQQAPFPQSGNGSHGGFSAVGIRGGEQGKGEPAPDGNWAWSTGLGQCLHPFEQLGPLRLDDVGRQLGKAETVQANQGQSETQTLGHHGQEGGFTRCRRNRCGSAPPGRPWPPRHRSRRW